MPRHGNQVTYAGGLSATAIALVDATTGEQAAGLPSSTADGGDATQGAVADAAVAAGAAGTLSAKLRSISRDIVANIVLAAGANIIGSIGGLGINVAATASDEGDESATDEAVAAAGAGTRLMGFSARETAGAAAVFSIHNGTGTGDPLLVTVSLGAGESAREWYGPDGIAAASGIYLQRVSGTVSFVGYYKVVA